VSRDAQVSPDQLIPGSTADEAQVAIDEV